MRTKNAIYNVVFTWIGQFLLILVTLVSRKIFLELLGAEYLGINSLFANILSFLSMAELGIGGAITYSLYKPIAEDDVEQIKSLMQLYRKAYWLIGIFVMLVGLILVPVLPHIITGGEGIKHLDLIYILFLVNTSVSYFFSYKSSFIIANQKKYIFNINHYLWQFAMYAIQIVILLSYKNYYVYLIIQIAVTLLENITIAKIVDKKYPFLKNKDVKPLQPETVSEIKKNTSSMLLNRIGSTLVNSTDNILISWLVSVAAVGIYGNYSTISTAVGNILYQGLYAVVASVGNLSASKDKDRKEKVFKLIYMVVIWLYGWAGIGLFVMLTPFVQIWYGADMLLGVFIIEIISLNLYIAGQTVLLNIHIDAMGLYWGVRFKGIVEAAINLIASVILGKKYGLIGILIGTLLSHVLYSFWKESSVVFRNGFGTTANEYYGCFFKDTVAVMIALFLTVFLADCVTGDGIGAFGMKLILAIVIPNLTFWIAFRKRPEFIELCNIFKKQSESFIKKFKKA